MARALTWPRGLGRGRPLRIGVSKAILLLLVRGDGGPHLSREGSGAVLVCLSLSHFLDI